VTSIDLSATTSGQGLISEVWSTGPTGITVPGTYTVTITDADNGCTASSTVAVDQDITLPIVSIATADELTCTVTSIDLNATTSGQGVISELWSAGPTGIASPGTYTVTITDSDNGCTASSTLTVSQDIRTFTATTTMTICDSEAPFTWNGVDYDVTTNTQIVLSSLVNGCDSIDVLNLTVNPTSFTTIDTVIVQNNTPFTLNGESFTQSDARTVTIPATNGADSTITMNVTVLRNTFNTVDSTICSSAVPFTLNGVTFNGSSSDVAILENAEGCDSIVTMNIVVRPAITAMITAQTNVSCNGLSDGVLTIGTNNAFGAVTISPDVNNLPAGVHVFTVSDECSSTTISATITEPDVLGATAIESIPVSCNGLSDGVAIVTPFGGTAPYIISPARNNLSAGTHTFAILDANGCTATVDVVITEPIVISIGVSDDMLDCFGGNDGILTSNVIGGTPNYTYSWSNGRTTSDISGIAVGTYTVTVQDANGCTASGSGIVDQPLELTTTATTIQNVSCFGLADGIGEVQAFGGTPNYTFDWGVVDPNALLAGTYVVTVSDDNNCIQTTSVVITQPGLLRISANDIQDELCDSGNGAVDVNVTGGTSPFSYTWSNGATTQDIDNLSDGLYNLRVVDVNNCGVASNFTVLNFGRTPRVSAGNNDIITCNRTIVNLQGTVVSGDDFTVEWLGTTNNVIATNTATSVTEPGTYTLIATNEFGCSSSDEVFIDDRNNDPNTELAVTDPTCGDIENGFIFAGTTSDFGDQYTYIINGSTRTNDPLIQDLGAGEYIIETINDFTGCRTIDTTELVGSGDIFLDIFSLDPSQELAEDFYEIQLGESISLFAAPFGGEAPFRYEWISDIGFEFDCNTCKSVTFTPPESNSVFVQVLDARGCRAEAFVHIDVRGEAGSKRIFSLR